jgi:hypothetical protein
MKLRSFFGLAAIGLACLSFASSCSDDSDDDGGGGTGGTASTGNGGSGTAGSGMAGSGMAGSSMTGSGGTGAQTGNLSFEDDVWPILTDMCGDCHGDSFAASGASDGDSSIAYMGILDDSPFDGEPRYSTIVGRIERGEMPLGSCNGPPGSTGCVSVADFNTIKAWSELGPPPPP